MINLINNLSKFNISIMTDSKKETFSTVDELANKQKFVDCYQMQVDNNNNCEPVHLGKYIDVPLPVNKIINYKNYDMHVVTYVLTKDEIENKIYKIVGVNLFKKGDKSSLCSLDFAKDPDKNNYNLIYSDHKKNTYEVVEKVDKFPGKDKVLEYIITKSFENPIKSILIS